MPQYSSEWLLQLLQYFFKYQDQVKQIHSLLITKAYLKNNSSISKWKPTLFYNTLSRTYLNFGQNYATLYLFNLMLTHHIYPNGYTFTSVLKAATLSFPCIGTSLHTQIIKRGVLYDPFVQTSLIGFYSQVGSLVNARKVFDEMLKPEIVEYNAMIDAYAKNDEMGSAVFLFEAMPKLDVVSWTSVINGFLRNGYFSEAIRFFRAMFSLGLVKPNEATFVSVLASCASLDNGGGLQFGRQIHGYGVRNEVVLTVFIGTALIDLYGKVGLLDYAIRVFDKMGIKKTCSWNAMIYALANNGREKQALNMFEMMKECGAIPNEVTFVAILTACARAELVEFGMKLFRSMWSEFGVKPIMEHYGCVVDLLGRAGLLREANELIKSMPFEPDASVYGALLGACKIHGAVELGNEVGKKLLQLQSLNCGHYVLLSSINAGIEKWNVAADVRKAMIETGIKKLPAHSSIDSIGR